MATARRSRRPRPRWDNVDNEEDDLPDDPSSSADADGDGIADDVDDFLIQQRPETPMTTASAITPITIKTVMASMTPSRRFE